MRQHTTGRANPRSCHCDLQSALLQRLLSPDRRWQHGGALKYTQGDQILLQAPSLSSDLITGNCVYAVISQHGRMDDALHQ